MSWENRTPRLVCSMDGDCSTCKIGRADYVQERPQGLRPCRLPPDLRAVAGKNKRKNLEMYYTDKAGCCNSNAPYEVGPFYISGRWVGPFKIQADEDFVGFEPLGCMDVVHTVRRYGS